jgi:hypothetical protein
MGTDSLLRLTGSWMPSIPPGCEKGVSPPFSLPAVIHTQGADEFGGGRDIFLLQETGELFD